MRAFLFDLDGTLIDSREDIAGAVNAALRELGRAELPVARVVGLVGQGAARLMERALGPEAGAAERQRALALFLRRYAERKLEKTRPYPGVEEGLRALAGAPLAVLSNKPARLSAEILEGLGLARHFRAIYGGDSFATMKPDPAGALAAAAALGARPADCALVGDSDVDVKTARAAGMLAVEAAYGFGARDRGALPADLSVGSLSELAGLVLPRKGAREP